MKHFHLGLQLREAHARYATLARLILPTMTKDEAAKFAKELPLYVANTDNRFPPYIREFDFREIELRILAPFASTGTRHVSMPPTGRRLLASVYPLYTPKVLVYGTIK